MLNKGIWLFSVYLLLLLGNISYANISNDYLSAEPKNLSFEKEKEFINGYKDWLKKNKSFQRPAIVWAAVDGHRWFVEMLIRHNESVDTEEKDGGNALSAAILNKRISIVSLLLEKGANPNFTYSNKMRGVKPIILASQTGNIKIIKMLLDKGSDVNYSVPNKYNTTPLYHALFHYQLPAAELLIQRGAVFKPYFRADGKIVPYIRRNACVLKKKYKTVFKYVACASEQHKLKPGFNCFKATTKIEKMICKESALAILDAEMTKVYKSSRKLKLSGVARKQRAWLSKRNKCEKNVDISKCLRNQYKSQLQTLFRKVLVKLTVDDKSYIPDVEISDVTISDDEVVYLIRNGEYRFGIISNKFFFSTFNGISLNSYLYCVKSYNEKGVLVSGDNECTKDMVSNKFAKIGAI